MIGNTIIEEIKKISYSVAASQEEISKGFQQIVYGIMFDPNNEGGDVIVPHKTLLEILNNLAELSSYEKDIIVVGFFIKNITSKVPIGKRYKLINVIMRQAANENGYRFYMRAQRRVPPEYRQDSLLLPLE